VRIICSNRLRIKRVWFKSRSRLPTTDSANRVKNRLNLLATHSAKARSEKAISKTLLTLKMLGPIHTWLGRLSLYRLGWITAERLMLTAKESVDWRFIPANKLWLRLQTTVLGRYGTWIQERISWLVKVIKIGLLPSISILQDRTLSLPVAIEILNSGTS